MDKEIFEKMLKEYLAENLSVELKTSGGMGITFLRVNIKLGGELIAADDIIVS